MNSEHKKLIRLAKDITRFWNDLDSSESSYNKLKLKYTKDEIDTVVSILKEANKNMIQSMKKHPEAYGMQPIMKDMNKSW